jgi:protein-S-isoprenylcysteine O-methyltransferase Ste14
MLKTIVFTLLVPGTVTVVIPYWLLSSRAPLSLQLGAFRHLGWFLILFGAGIYFWCAWDFTVTGRGTPAPIDPPKELVVRGLYRYVRNPMYVGVSSILMGQALLFESRRLLVYAAGTFLVFFLVVVLYEEPNLRHKFGELYRRYCRKVPRWLPVKISSKKEAL